MTVCFRGGKYGGFLAAFSDLVCNSACGVSRFFACDDSDSIVIVKGAF